MSVTVAEEGNRRKGGPSSTEVRQSILDIKSWFVRVSSGKFAPNEGATSVATQRLQKAVDTKIPDDLLLLLTEINGGLWFDDKQSYGSEEIIEVIAKNDRNTKLGWQTTFVPFAGDDSTILVINSATEQVFEYEIEDGLPEDSEPLASSFGAYLEQYRNKLLMGKHEYIDGCGVTEKMGASKSRK